MMTDDRKAAPAEFKRALASTLRNHREATGLSIPELARLTGLTEPYLRKLEYEDTERYGTPSLDTLYVVAAAMGTSIDRLLGTAVGLMADTAPAPLAPASDVAVRVESAAREALVALVRDLEPGGADVEAGLAALRRATEVLLVALRPTPNIRSIGHELAVHRREQQPHHDESLLVRAARAAHATIDEWVAFERGLLDLGWHRIRPAAAAIGFPEEHFVRLMNADVHDRTDEHRASSTFARVFLAAPDDVVQQLAAVLAHLLDPVHR